MHDTAFECLDALINAETQRAQRNAERTTEAQSSTEKTKDFLQKMTKETKVRLKAGKFNSRPFALIRVKGPYPRTYL